MWAPGFGLQQNKLTTTVVHKFQFVMLEGHDCGYMIPHVTIPAANLALPMIIMFSGRKVMFSASTVKANGTAVGCSQLLLLPLPMMTCAAPVSIPTSFPPLNLINNVKVGMTPGDLFAGIIAIGLSILADYICYRFKDNKFFKNLLNGPLGKMLGKTLGETAGKAYGKMLGGLLGKAFGASNIGGYLVKAVLGGIAGGAKILLTGEGSIKVAVGSSYAGGNVAYGRTIDGKNQYSVQGQVAPTPFTSASASAQHTSNPDGTTANQTSHTEASPVVQHTHKSKTDYDSSGHEKATTDTDATAGGIVPAPEVGAAGVHQTQTTKKPGKAPETSTSDFGGAGTPFGGGQFWGPSL
jgi:hypothetical protein